MEKMKKDSRLKETEKHNNQIKHLILLIKKIFGDN